MKQILGVTERNGKSFWTRIGVAFENKDGSWNLLFDFLPTNPDSTIQLRDMPPKEEGAESSRFKDSGRGPRQAKVKAEVPPVR